MRKSLPSPALAAQISLQGLFGSSFPTEYLLFGAFASRHCYLRSRFWLFRLLLLTVSCSILLAHIRFFLAEGWPGHFSTLHGVLDLGSLQFSEWKLFAKMRRTSPRREHCALK